MRELPPRSDPRWLIAIVAGLGLVAVAVGTLGAFLADGRWFDDLWFEVAKAGVQLVTIGVLGGTLTAAWKIITDMRQEEAAKEAKKLQDAAATEAKERDREIERNEKIRAELVSLFDTYNGVKTVRRTIRSLGLDLKTYPDAERETARRTAVLTQAQAEGFHAQMRILSGLQLDFEAKARQFGQTDLLGNKTAQVVDKLSQIENHLNLALQLWEKNGWAIREGTPLHQVPDGLELLLRVREHLRPNVSIPLREITEIINEHVFQAATTSTKIALDRALARHEDRDQGQSTAGGAAP
jgi:hypothetical protein